MIQDSILIGLLDDHTIFRKAMANYLNTQNNIEVAEQASSPEEFLNKTKSKHVDILVTDLYMPGVSGADVVKMISQQEYKPRILFLSMCTDPKIISALLDEGIYGFISKGDEPEELIKAINSAYNNRIYRNNHFTEALYWNNEKNKLSGPVQSRVELDEREKQIIQLLWQEKSNKEIAEEIFLSTRSVEKIRQNLKTKLGVKSTVGVFKYAIRQGFIALPESSLNA